MVLKYEEEELDQHYFLQLRRHLGELHLYRYQPFQLQRMLLEDELIHHCKHKVFPHKRFQQVEGRLMKRIREFRDRLCLLQLIHHLGILDFFLMRKLLGDELVHHYRHKVFPHKRYQ